MKKQILFSIYFLLMSAILIGQNPSIVLISSTGKISYTNGTKPPMTIAAGAVLDPNGTVTLPDKAAAKIFCNGGYYNLSKGKNILSRICGGVGSKSLGIDGKFTDFVIASLQLAATADGQNSGWAKVTDSKSFAGDGWGADPKNGWGADPKNGWGTQGKNGWGTDPKSGWGADPKNGWGADPKNGWGADPKNGWGADPKNGWGADPKNGWGADPKNGWGADPKNGWGADPKNGWGADPKNGWGGQGTKILLLMPIGKLEAKLTHFSWTKPANTKSFKFEIQDKSAKTVYTKVVKDTFVEIDLKKLNLTTEQVYVWMVSSVENAEAFSKVYQFGIEPHNVKQAVEAKLAKSKIYKTADHTTRSLMEAVVLENDNWFYDAEQIYSSLVKKDHNNNLVNMMHAAFWMRGGMPQMADAVVMTK